MFYFLCRSPEIQEGHHPRTWFKMGTYRKYFRTILVWNLLNRLHWNTHSTVLYQIYTWFCVDRNFINTITEILLKVALNTITLIAILQVGWQKLFLEIMQCCISNVEYDCLADLLGNDIILLFIILLGK
jgi:hypothetical protein